MAINTSALPPSLGIYDPEVGQRALASIQNAQLNNARLAQIRDERTRAAAKSKLTEEAFKNPQALQQLAAIDPQAAQGIIQTQTYQKNVENYRAQKSADLAGFVKNKPASQKPAAYKQSLEEAKKLGLDISTLPAEYTPDIDIKLDALVAAGRSSKDLLSEDLLRAQINRATTGGESPSAVREYEYYQSLSPAEQQQFLNVKRNVLQTGLTFDEQGAAVPISGITGAKTDIKAAESKGTALGKTQAELQASIGSQESKLPELEKTVGELSSLGKKATYTQAGILRDNALRQAGLPMSEGGIARAEYISRVDNQILPLLRDTFGAAFTEREGQTLRATLGDPNATPEEKDAKLKAFIEQKKASVKSAKRQAGLSGGSENLSGQVGNIGWRLK